MRTLGIVSDRLAFLSMPLTGLLSSQGFCTAFQCSKVSWCKTRLSSLRCTVSYFPKNNIVPHNCSLLSVTFSFFLFKSSAHNATWAEQTCLLFCAINPRLLVLAQTSFQLQHKECSVKNSLTKQKYNPCISLCLRQVNSQVGTYLFFFFFLLLPLYKALHVTKQE